MADAVEYLASAALIGTGATIVMDIWGMVRAHLLGVPSLDYALVGRWLGHLASGRLRHDRIAASPQVTGPAVLVGIGSVAAPFLVMQPARGAGIAASRTPHPWAARLQSLVTHAVFGGGLYAAGWIGRLSSSW